ncbi:unnamed protein product [Linum trigynum]|uniref:Uncharacterized protein n=1 Tax=Linum trigynum TaxID=586398 RepID=A0AAV2E2U0_9ROSI
MQEKMKVKKGWLAVQVGLEEEDRRQGYDTSRKFVIPISYLYHPLFKNLLDKAHEVFGYHAAGPLRLPCSVDDFLHLRWQIEREPDHHHSHSHRHHIHRGGSSSSHHHHHLLPTAFSFHSC